MSKKVLEESVNGEGDRYRLKNAAQAIATATRESNKVLKDMLQQAVREGLLSVYRPGSSIDRLPLPVRLFWDEAYWNDLNRWLETCLPHLDFRFPNPTARSETKEHPLAVFRAMENLHAREIQINLKADSLRVGVLARGKKYEVSMRDFKLINAKRDRLLKTGAAFIAIARDEYDYDPSDRTHSKMANGIKNALGLIDYPFENGKPKFKFRVSEDETAKFKAEKTAGYLSDTDTAGNLSDTDEDYEPSNNASNEFSPHENSG